MAHSARTRSSVDPLLAAIAGVWAGVKAVEDALLRDPSQARRSALQQWVAVSLADLDALQADLFRWSQSDLGDVYDVGTEEVAGTSDSEARDVALAVIAAALLEKAIKAIDATRSQIQVFVRGVSQDPVLSDPLSSVEEKAAAIRELFKTLGINSVEYVDGSMHGLDQYLDTIVDTAASIAHNAGRLAGWPDVGTWEISDGPDCGWTTHDDPDLADGSTRTREEVEAYPIAHPRCQRVVWPVQP